MSLLRRWLFRIGALLHPSRQERELTRELDAHLALIEAGYRARGLSAADARAAALRALGGLDQAREVHRDHRSFPWLEDLRRDVPYAIRNLGRQRGFAVTALVTIAVGVGATTAIVSVINMVLLRPLPYRDSDRLVQIAENVTRDTPDGPRYSRRFGMTQAEFLEWRSRATSFAQMAGVINLMSGTLATADGTVAAPRAIVSPALFEMLGIAPLLGRTLGAADERGDAEAAVISYGGWQRFFGGDPAIVGTSVTLNNTPFTIVGVMPPGFDYPERSTVFWTPLAPRPGPGTNPFGNVVAKLRAGISLAAATDEAAAIGTPLRPPPMRAGYGAAPPAAPPLPPATATMGGQFAREINLEGRPRFEVLRVKDLIVAPIRPSMRVLAVAVIAVLLIVCANVANLLLVRGSARQREIGVRLALGASRGRIIRQIVAESVVLSLAGGLAGVAIAVAGVQLVRLLATVETPRLFQLSIDLGNGSLLPRIGEFGVDASVLGFALLIAAATGVIFGLAPALSMSGSRAFSAIRLGATIRTPGASTPHRLRDLLVVLQVAMAAILLVGASLLVRSFWNLLSVDAGYDPRGVVTFQLVLPQQMPGPRQVAVIEQVVSTLGTDPRIASAGYTNIAPYLSLTEYGGLLVPPGSSHEDMLDDPLRPQLRVVSHNYLPTMGARLLEGRWLTASDGGARPPVLLVNRALVQRYFAGRNPVGTLVRIYRSPEHVESWQIVGVVDDLKQARLDQDAFPLIFVDLRQALAARDRLPADLRLGQPLSGFPTIAVRVDREWDDMPNDFRGVVRAVDPTVNIDAIASLESLRYGSLVRPRFYAVLLGCFAAVAACLAAVGIYGVLAFAVVQRTHEIGVRIALGAERRRVLLGVLRRGLVLLSIGLAIGLAGAIVLTRSLATMLYGLTPHSPAVYAAVAAGFLMLGLLASLVPARRATRVDPIVALRCE
jgi:predicted permease